MHYGEVSDDSDGPPELCRPVADAPAAGSGDLASRAEAAHDEAFIRLPAKDVSWPGVAPDGGLMLSIYPRSELAKDADVPLAAAKPGEFSIGHVVASRAEVDDVIEQAKAARQPSRAPRTTGRGASTRDTSKILTGTCGRSSGTPHSISVRPDRPRPKRAATRRARLALPLPADVSPARARPRP